MCHVTWRHSTPTNLSTSYPSISKHLGYERRATILQTHVSFKLSGDEITWSQWSVMQHVLRAFSRSTHTHGSEPDYSFVFQEEGLQHSSMFVSIIISRTRAGMRWDAPTEEKQKEPVLFFLAGECNPNKNVWSCQKFKNLTRSFKVKINFTLT